MLANRVRMSQIKKGIPSYYVMAQDSDFSGDWNGDFRYIGSDEYVVIPQYIKGVRVTSYRYMFRDTSVKGVASTNKNVTNMQAMFYNSKATSLDLSNLDTSGVTDMSWVFDSSQATSIDVRNVDTSSVTNMLGMFYNTRATSLDLSSFDISSVTEKGMMFKNSQATIGYARTQADADKFNTSSDKPAGLTFVVK